MGLDLRSVFETEGSKKEISEQLDEREYELFGTKPFVERISVRGEVANRAGVVTLSVQVSFPLRVACDRCLEDCRLPVAFDGTLLVRFSDEVADYDGEVMWISPAEGEVSLAQYIYESIVLSLPYQRVHPEGECDADMLHRFRIVSQEEFSQIEHDAETRAEVSQPLDGDALAQLASLKEKLEGEKK